VHIVYECWQNVNSVESGYCVIASLLNHQTLVGVSTLCHASKQPEHINYECLENPKVYEKNESTITCVFHFSLQVLFSILMHAEMFVDLHVKCLQCCPCSDETETW
jgi:hypothetical protein